MGRETQERLGSYRERQEAASQTDRDPEKDQGVGTGSREKDRR